MTTTFPTNSTFCGNTSNGFGGIPAPTGNVPFNGFTPSSYAGTTTGYPYPGFTNGTFANPGYTPGFNAPGFSPTPYGPSNFQWPQQWSQFSNAPIFGGWNNPGFRAQGYSGFSGFGGFAPSPFTSGFGYPAFNSFPSFNNWPSFNFWPTPGFPQGSFPQNFAGFTPGFVNPFTSYESGFGGNGLGGFPAWNWQQSYNTPFSTFNTTTPYGYGFNTPFNFAQGYSTPSFGAFPWTPGYTSPFSGPTNYGGQFNYAPFNGPFNGTYGQPFNGQHPTGQYTNGQFVNGYTPTGGSVPGTCNGIGLNREAA